MGTVVAVQFKAISEAKRILKYKLKKVEVETLSRLIKEQQYDIVYYTPGKSNETLESVKQTEYAKTVRAFAYANTAGKKIVFINTQKNKNGYLHSLAHELGHILLGHLDNIGEPRNIHEEEEQAEAFSKVLLRHADKVREKGGAVNV